MTDLCRDFLSQKQPTDPDSLTVRCQGEPNLQTNNNYRLVQSRQFCYCNAAIKSTRHAGACSCFGSFWLIRMRRSRSAPTNTHTQCHEPTQIYIGRACSWRPKALNSEGFCECRLHLNSSAAPVGRDQFVVGRQTMPRPAGDRQVAACLAEFISPTRDPRGGRMPREEHTVRNWKRWLPFVC